MAATPMSFKHPTVTLSGVPRVVAPDVGDVTGGRCDCPRQD
jgi:hypothetical protein